MFGRIYYLQPYLGSNVFFVRKVIKLHFLCIYAIIEIISFILNELWKFWLSEIFHFRDNLIGVKAIHNIISICFNFNASRSVVMPLFRSDFDGLYYFFFLLININWNLPILLIYSKRTNFYVNFLFVYFFNICLYL